MSTNEIESLEAAYKLPEVETAAQRYELAIVHGMKRDIAWDNLDDKQKLEVRKGDLVHLRKTKKINSQLQINYEEAVIELTTEILSFLKTNYVVENVKSDLKTKDEVIRFRLNAILRCEFYAINKHRKLENGGGHVLYHEVIRPILNEVKMTRYGSEHGIEQINKSYLRVIDLYEQDPYGKKK